MNITTTPVVLAPGMYVLRHPKGEQAPLSVTRAPGSAAHQGKLELLGTPMTHGSILRDGSDCIVAHVSEGPVELAVSAYLENAAATVPALRVDQIALDAPAAVAAAMPAPVLPPAAAKRAIQVSAKGMSIIAHIERTGDVVAAEGMTAGDPCTLLRVEGFQVMWPDRPAGVDLACSVKVDGLGLMPQVTTGKFCGTRGQARRVTEVSFTLVGPESAQYALEGHAWFAGGFQLPVISGAILSGPSGLEHLTALSLKPVPASAAKPAANPWTESEKTKVFKAKAASPAKPAAKQKAATPTSKARRA